LLIVFSGMDGAGKSTQIERLLGRLKAAGKQPLALWTRGGYTPNFNTLKALIRNLSRSQVVPPSGANPQRTQAFTRPTVRRLWLTLALLDLIWVYGAQVRWNLWRGKIIICDRYLWDTLIDFRLNYPQENVERWWLWHILSWITPRPQATFLFLIPVGLSVQRTKQKGLPFQDPPEVLSQRLAQYQEFAGNYGWLVLDGQRSISDLEIEIWERVEKLSSQRHPQPI
jgi:dTMP kinase